MIELSPRGPTLTRFVRELEAQAPRSLTGLRPDLEGTSEEDRLAAQLGWASRIVDEHRSVIVFSELLGILASEGAPFDTLAAMQRLIGDELRHVALCAAVSEWFGPLDDIELDLSELGLPPWDGAPLVRAIDIVARELVIAEGESVAVLRAYRDAATDPACRVALSILLTDEARHYAAGKHLLERLFEWAPLEIVAAMKERLPPMLARDAKEIRDAHRAAATGGPGRAFGVSITLDEAPPAHAMALS